MNDWRSVKDLLPLGQWNINHKQWSEEVLIANSCSISIGYYDRNVKAWYVANQERIDKITHWMPLPINPHTEPLDKCEILHIELALKDHYKEEWCSVCDNIAKKLGFSALEGR